MRYSFVKFGITASLELDKNRKDAFFYEQNRDNFNQIFEFLSGNKPCFVLSGFQGVGKSKIINEALSYLNSDVLLFKYHMYEATTLDDILMLLMKDFHEYYKNTKTAVPKIDTKDFRERIQSYVKNIQKPMLLVLEAYENILRFEDTRTAINEFLFHLASTEKFKIIFIARNFDSQIFKEKNIDFEKIIITAVDEDKVGEYLNKNGISTSKESVEKLITHSHCYLNYIDMAIKIMQTLNISLDDFMRDFEAKKTNFSTFMIGKFITLIPDKAKEIINILTLIRQGVSPDFVKSINKQNVNIDYLKNIWVLRESKGNLYLKDYFKKELLKDIDKFTKLKIHSYLAQLYADMLPKKPYEREFFISRSTMQRERNYHESFIENYKDNKNTENTLRPANGPVEILNLAEIDFDEEKIKNDAAAIPDIKSEAIFTPSTPETDEAYKFQDYIGLAEKYEKDFDYKTAAFYYQRALEKNQEPSFELIRPDILTKIAHCYIKTHKSEKAVKCFELANEHYTAQKQFDKANDILFQTALEYKNNYKFLVAKNYLEKIIQSEYSGAETLAKAYNLLADIEDLSSNVRIAKELYKKSLDNAIQTTNTELICMAYFKYGLLLDDTNQQSEAVECYKNCIKLCDTPGKNSYLSSAYSNLANIYYEAENIKSALEFYQKALDADTKTNNDEGIYFVYSKLAQIYEQTDKNSCFKYLNNALSAAKRLKDKLYIASANMEIGDYYYREREFVPALNSYLGARELLKDSTDENNKLQIETRLKDLKIKMGEGVYSAIEEHFGGENGY